MRFTLDMWVLHVKWKKPIIFVEVTIHLGSQRSKSAYLQINTISQGTKHRYFSYFTWWCIRSRRKTWRSKTSKGIGSHQRANSKFPQNPQGQIFNHFSVCFQHSIWAVPERNGITWHYIRLCIFLLFIEITMHFWILVVLRYHVFWISISNNVCRTEIYLLLEKILFSVLEGQV